MRKSFELNWVRLKCDKSIPMPEVVFYSLDDCAGKYYHPENHELYDVDGKPYHMRYGVIVVDPDTPLIHTTIAHEWRHHWQYYHGIEFEISSIVDNESYNESLLQYVTGSKTELDAIRFEYKYAGTYPEWEKPLYSVLKDLMPKKVWI